jgi:hypothetical protein
MFKNYTSSFKKFLALLLLVGNGAIVQAQNNALVINGAYINVSGGTWASPVYLVVNNGTPAAITRTTGAIISESEGSYVRWITAHVAAPTAYVFPFGFSNTDYLPVTVHKTLVGVVNNAGAIDMSTWASPNTNLAYANTVTAMTGLGGATAVNSVIDRWWQLISLNTVSGTADFTYRGVENTTAYPAGPFSGQEWDIPSTAWLTATGTGPGVVAGTATVTGVVMNEVGLGVSSPYILSATIAPLPIELVSFTATCKGTQTEIKWTDASETNVSTIELQKSDDMNTWTTIYEAAPSNQSTTTNYMYTYQETETNSLYYRLKTNNLDGGTDISGVLYHQPCNSPANTLSAFYSNSTLNVLSHFAADDKVTYKLYDIQGKVVLAGEYTAGSGTQLLTFPVDELDNAIYIFRAESSTTNYNQKIIIAR